MIVNAERGKAVYRIETASRRVEKQLDKLSNTIYDKVAQAIRNLAVDPRPRGVRKLSKRVYRIRVGDYRIVYSIFDDKNLIVIDKVDRRKERTYKRVL
ncbi:MAG: type II toxin-antitoxin system RelE/ParE family toxin [bacterium]